jgi:lipoate-protein ligase A
VALEKLPEFPGDEIAIQAIESGENNYINVYEHKDINVVLGKSTKLYPDINVEECEKERVAILRRKGGGGAVVLSPGVWVITACYANSQKDINIPLVLERIVLEIAKGLERATNVMISMQGMGDLCIGDKKILGSSLYSGRGAILYQGSLLVNNDLNLIVKLLNHPSSEPKYRQGRKHEDFITNLSFDAEIDTNLMEQCLRHKLQNFKI